MSTRHCSSGERYESYSRGGLAVITAPAIAAAVASKSGVEVGVCVGGLGVLVAVGVSGIVVSVGGIVSVAVGGADPGLQALASKTSRYRYCFISFYVHPLKS